MAKWEYAAIVADGTVKIAKQDVPRYFLVQPGKDLHYTVSWKNKGESGRQIKNPALYTWSIPVGLEKTEKNYQKLIKNNMGFIENPKTSDASPRILYESTDILHLVNLAGADGWEITGALGLPGVPEHRMMRREI